MGCIAPKVHVDDTFTGIISSQTSELNLRNVAIRGKSVDRLVKALEHGTSLVSVRLCSCSIEDEGILKLSPVLASMKALKSLDLAGNYVENHGAKCLACALTSAESSLSELVLWDNRIERESAAFAECRSLTHLILGYNALGHGAGRFAIALKDNTSMVHLDLCHNHLLDASLEELAKALSGNTSLTSIALSKNRCGQASLAQFAVSLRSNSTLRSLKLKSCSVEDAAALQLGDAVEGSRSLKTLDLYDNNIAGFATRQIAAALATSPPLTYLNLSCNRLGDAGATMLASALYTNHVLLELNLWKNQIRDFGANRLAACLRCNKSLTTLGLKQNTISTACVENFTVVLEHNARITALELDEEDLPEDYIARLDNALRKNRRSEHGNCSIIEASPSHSDSQHMQRGACNISMEAAPCLEVSDQEWAGYLTYLVYMVADSASGFNALPLEVATGIYLGDHQVACNVSALEACGIDRVLCMAPDDCGRSVSRGYPEQFVTIDIPSHDTNDYDIFLNDVPAALRFLHTHIDDGHRVLVHCYAGQNRSATVCAAWCLHTSQKHLSSIVNDLATRRGLLLQNTNFLVGLVTMARTLGLLGSEE